MTDAFRSLLFVPGDRPERFDKAAASGADAVIVDLEDAVLPADKDAARTAALAWLGARSGGGPKAGLRINSLRTADGCADVAALASASGAGAAFVMVPKCETAADLEIVGEALGGGQLMAVIESPRGLHNVFDIAPHAPAGLLFGGADYSLSLGARLDDWDAMLTARSLVAAAAAHGGAPAYDVPFLDVKDEAGLRQTSARALALGFTGRACIHPAQVAGVNETFSPSAGEIEEARAVIEAFESARGGAALHRGKLLDRPVILAAQRVLAASQRAKD